MVDTNTVSKVARAIRFLTRPSVVAGAVGVAAGLLTAPSDGKTLRHRLRGVISAARSTPGGDETDQPSAD